MINSSATVNFQKIQFKLKTPNHLLYSMELSETKWKKKQKAYKEYP